MRTLYKHSFSAFVAAALAFSCAWNGKPVKEPAPYSEANAASETSETTMTHAEQPLPRGGGPQDTGAASSPHDEPTSTTTTSQAAMDTKTVTSLSDGEVFAIETALNDGEIKLAELAKKRALHAQVKAFASSMLTAHREVQNQAKIIAGKSNIVAKEGAVSSKLKADATSAESDLKPRKGHDFDTSYMDSQVKMHTDALAIIDNQLLPSVQNDELKGHLRTVRTHVSNHLATAQDVATRVGAVGSASTTGGPPTPTTP